MKPSDIARIVQVADPVLSPDGHTVALVVRRIDVEANLSRSAIWTAPVDGSSAPTQLTAGQDRDEGPAWSPDGRHLAFSRALLAEKPVRNRLQVIPVDGPGELRMLAEGAEGFGDIEWSPDGNRLLGTVRVRDASYTGDDDRARPARRINNLRSRLDNEGWIVDRRRHVFVVNADGVTPLRHITSGPFEHDWPRWSPDGAQIVCVSPRHEDWDLRPAADLFVLDPDGAPGSDAALVPLTDTTTDIYLPAWAPDGSRIAAIANDERSIPHNSHIIVVDARSGATTTLTAALDRNCAPSTGARAPIWSADGRSLLFSVEDHGNVALYGVAADGSSPPEPVLEGERWITGFDAVASTIAFTATTTTVPTELFVTVDSGEPRKLTTVQTAFLTACPALDAERFDVPSPAGDGELDVWLVRPPEFDSKGRYPMLLTIHGGPMTQYGNRWLDEVQLYASAGFVVLYTNPHGSTGGTEAFLRSIRSPLAADDPGTGWGGIDYEDLMAVVDAALVREPAIDPARLGVIGGSYGGYMASWIIGHTNRFAAACSERAVNNMLTLEWTSDIAAIFRHEVGVDPIDDEQEFIRQSPIAYVRSIETPVLILHSENDLRCPIEQADQLYGRLRLLGKPCEYWRFPAEGHELSRSGAPRHRVQRAEIILDWFGRHLGQ